MSVVFLKPMFLVLLVLGLAPWLFPGRRRGGWHPFIRAAIYILLALALARPTIVSRVDRGTEVIVQDGESSEMTAWLEAGHFNDTDLRDDTYTHIGVACGCDNTAGVRCGFILANDFIANEKQVSPPVRGIFTALRTEPSGGSSR